MAIVLELPRDIDRLCRTCMNLIDHENNVSNFVISNNTQTELCGMLQTVTSLKVTIQDGLPKSLCSHCADQVKTTYTFILQCTQVDQNLKRILESTKCINGEPSNVTKLITETLDDDFTCSSCQLSFTSYYELSMHLITHNSSKSLIERFNESLCNIDNKYKVDVNQDIEEQRLLIEECRNNLSLQNVTSIGTKCHKMVIDQGKLKITGPGLKKKLQCKSHEKFQSEETFQRHTLKECNSKYKPSICNLCGKKCKDLSSLSLHFLNHSLASELLSGNGVSEVYFCEFCGQLFEDDSCLSQHYTEQHENRPNWKCLDCLEIFDTEKDFLSHTTCIRSYDENNDSKEEIQCVLCPENFNSKSELYKHSLTHLMKRYTCRKCSLSFCTQDSYFAHLQVHSSGKHVCSLCGKCLSTNSALKCHIEGVHPVELRHCCSVCGKCFATFTRLKTHSKIHTSEKKYVCSYCGYSSHKSGDLVMHTRIHTSERPYKCTFPNCTMSFKTSSHLCHHVRRHLQIKKFKCSVCLMKFSTSHGLKVHQMQHTGEKPHPCIVCKKSFRRKYHLKVHMKQHSRS